MYAVEYYMFRRREIFQTSHQLSDMDAENQVANPSTNRTKMGLFVVIGGLDQLRRP